MMIRTMVLTTALVVDSPTARAPFPVCRPCMQPIPATMIPKTTDRIRPVLKSRALPRCMIRFTYVLVSLPFVPFPPPCLPPLLKSGQGGPPITPKNRGFREGKACSSIKCVWMFLTSRAFVMAACRARLFFARRQPVMPDAMASLLDQLGQGKDRRSFADLAQAIEPGTTLPKPEGVFPRYLDETAA